MLDDFPASQAVKIHPDGIRYDGEALHGLMYGDDIPFAYNAENTRCCAGDELFFEGLDGTEARGEKGVVLEVGRGEVA